MCVTSIKSIVGDVVKNTRRHVVYLPPPIAPFDSASKIRLDTTVWVCVIVIHWCNKAATVVTDHGDVFVLGAGFFGIGWPLAFS